MPNDNTWVDLEKFEATASKGVRAAERVTVTRITVREGVGVAPYPIRLVTYWYDDDGNLIARVDPEDTRKPPANAREPNLGLGYYDPAKDRAGIDGVAEGRFPPSREEAGVADA